MPYELSDQKREWYRRVSAWSRLRKQAASCGELAAGAERHVNVPNLDPACLMPQRAPHGLRALSLFSGGGGLDLAFERAGFAHVASFDVLEICGATLRRSRPGWRVSSGSAGDVCEVDWTSFKGGVDIVHGGPPCQPFSIAGKRKGGEDGRDMWPAFTAVILKLAPCAFVAENVTGLLDAKFNEYVGGTIVQPLAHRYHIVRFRLSASDFGVPQVRKRVFFVGFRSRRAARAFRIPSPTHGRCDDFVRTRQNDARRQGGAGVAGHRFRQLRPDAAFRLHGAAKVHQHSEQQGQPGCMGAIAYLAEWSAEESRRRCKVSSRERTLPLVRAGLRRASGLSGRLAFRGRRIPGNRTNR